MKKIKHNREINDREKDQEIDDLWNQLKLLSLQGDRSDRKTNHTPIQIQSFFRRLRGKNREKEIEKFLKASRKVDKILEEVD